MSAKPRARGGFVYLVEGGGVFKIGASRSRITGNRYNQRLRAMNTGSPVPLTVVCELPIRRYAVFEKALHRHFADKRERLEWFRLTAEDVEWIKGVASRRTWPRELSVPRAKSVKRHEEEEEGPPLTVADIRYAIMKNQDTVAGLADQWGVKPENISRVINRTSPHRQDAVRKKLARYLGVSISRVGRENGSKSRGKA